MAKSTGKALGKGLSALLPKPDSETSALQTVTMLPLQKLEPNPKQPRKDFDPDSMLELEQSIYSHGILQPITVRDMGTGYYQIIAGERRWRAARSAGLTEVPVYILDVDDQTAAELSLIENLVRNDLNPVEEAVGYSILMQDYSLTQEEVSDRIGKSRSAVANSLRLLSLPESILNLVRNNQLSAGHARTLIPLQSESLILSAADKVVSRQLSVRQTEKLVKQMLKAGPEKPTSSDPLRVDYIKECETDLQRTLGRKVAIHFGRKKGTLELEFYGEEDFAQLNELLHRISSKSIQR